MKTILVVDDDALIREICADILKEANYNVVTARDAVEGLDILRKEEINACSSTWSCQPNPASK